MVRHLLMRCPRGRSLACFFSNRTGSAAVEFALVAPPFFALLFAILETGLVFLAGQVLDNATEDAARLVLTGQRKSPAITAESFKSDVCKRIPPLFDCGGLAIDVKSYGLGSPPTPTSPIVDGKLVTKDFGFTTGNAGDVVVVRLFYQWPLVVTGLGYNIANLSGSKRLLSTTLAFRNEPF
ncbi:pilus assembly protein [Rhodopseudomonas sp. HC1]|uniref:TadE/TadG family type IV pilus assembly protein n=1 Tax=Rhodopseudomonas infernalis TaxID=2897386 RepID=UPI001EE9329A|nr:TadE/TadG family type IV pilus assembly protein [Rhodopseudomonas infernalis]MCG6203052.1 pilus assembly protein [Rhodopseudomonas infernalis]